MHFIACQTDSQNMSCLLLTSAKINRTSVSTRFQYIHLLLASFILLAWYSPNKDRASSEYKCYAISANPRMTFSVRRCLLSIFRWSIQCQHFATVSSFHFSDTRWKFLAVSQYHFCLINFKRAKKSA